MKFNQRLLALFIIIFMPFTSCDPATIGGIMNGLPSSPALSNAEVIPILSSK